MFGHDAADDHLDPAPGGLEARWGGSFQTDSCPRTTGSGLGPMSRQRTAGRNLPRMATNFPATTDDDAYLVWSPRPGLDSPHAPPVHGHPQDMRSSPPKWMAPLTQSSKAARRVLKERYPLVPIERYVAWKRPDASPFDPWIRVHAGLGGKILKPAPQSLKIVGRVQEWESWTQLDFPESGEYVIPQGLALLAVDRIADLGTYFEPNVWIQHQV